MRVIPGDMDMDKVNHAGVWMKAIIQGCGGFCNGVRMG